MPVPNTFANATATIPLSQLDANFATTITLGNTAIQLGNTVSTLNNMTLANVTVSSGNVTITNVTVTTANVTTANIATAQIANVTVSGTGTFAAGSNTAPSITTSGDTNTGIFFPAADTIAFTEGGVESMRIDSAGNMGLGTATPTSTYSARFASVAAAGTSAISLDAPTGTNTSINFYYNGSAKWTTQVLTTGEYRWYDFTAAAERMRLDNSGNLGLGVTPSAWSTGSSVKAFQNPAGGLWNFGTNYQFLGQNYYFNSSNQRIYLTTAAASEYAQVSGQHQWFNAPSGTAGNAITFTQAMTLDASGNLIVGGTSASGILTLGNSSKASTTAISVKTSTGDNSFGTQFGAYGALASGDAYIYAPTSGTSITLMADNATGTIKFASGGNTERARITSGGNFGVGVTPADSFNFGRAIDIGSTTGSFYYCRDTDATNGVGGIGYSGTDVYVVNKAVGNIRFFCNPDSTERARITDAGDFLVGTTSAPNVLTATTTVTGSGVNSSGYLALARSSGSLLYCNRLTSDGLLVEFIQAGVKEGDISVSGTTVSYNGGHLARWSQLLSGQRDESIVKGTVLSNLDEMCEWLDAEGNPLPNEQLNRMKVSDVEGDTNVAGVFVNWDNDDQDNPYDMNIAMTGDMIIRIAQGVTVQKGDLLMSAGDGTAKPQGDDIVRSKTVAKVTSNHVTCTYEDGSYCVPCVLMAC